MSAALIANSNAVPASARKVTDTKRVAPTDESYPNYLLVAKTPKVDVGRGWTLHDLKLMFRGQTMSAR
jgi:hypothetical protein